jgi:hypothetical protein
MDVRLLFLLCVV